MPKQRVGRVSITWRASSGSALRWCPGLVMALASCAIPTPRSERGRVITPSGSFTRPNQPSGRTSEEATSEQLGLAREQGQAAAQALDYLVMREAVASSSARAGDYQLTVALIPPDEGTAFARSGSRVHWAVVVRDGYDGRLVPNLSVRGRLLDRAGKALWSGALSAVCDPLLHHYGAELELDGPGPYRAEVSIDPARFWRHDPINGDRYRRVTEAVFKGLSARLPLSPVQPNAARRLELARRQGLSLERALSTMLYDVAVDGHEIRVGDYQVAYAVEYAEGFWYPHGEGLTYHYGAEESTRHNAHVEVAVRDVATGRLLTELPITATLLFEKKMLGSKQEWLMWHPWLYHYGRNWRVPHGGTYGLRVELGPPRCNLRFDLGAYPEPRSVVVDFDRVQIEPGQK